MKLFGMDPKLATEKRHINESLELAIKRFGLVEQMLACKVLAENEDDPPRRPTMPRKAA